MNVIGKRASELFGTNFLASINYVKILDKGKRPITYSFYTPQTNKHQEIVLALSSKKDYIDVFGVDSTDLYHTQQKLNATNQKLIMALEVADIIPWKWDLERRMILCDINRPIELSTEEQDVTEEQLSVPDAQLLCKNIQGRPATHREGLSGFDNRNYQEGERRIPGGYPHGYGTANGLGGSTGNCCHP